MPTLGKAIAWWTGELAALWPTWSAGEGKRGGAAEITLDGAVAHVRLPSDRSSWAVDLSGEAAADQLATRIGGERRRPVALRFPARQSLTRTVDLPQAAAGNLRDILAFELSRHTPFRPSQVHYGYEIVETDAANKRLKVRLTVVPVVAVDESLKRLADAGVAVDRLIVEDDSGVAQAAIDVRAAEQKVSATATMRRVNIGLAILCAVLACAAVAVPLMKYDAAERDLKAQVASVRAEAMKAADLREDLRTHVARASTVNDLKRARPTMTKIVDALSRLLPDDTWISRLDVKGDDVQIQGNSPQAAALIERLEQSPLFTDVTFKSPVRREDGGGERFHVGARIEPAGAL